jgi:hypothetical protein
MTAFGLAVNLPHKAGTIVFIVVLVILLLLEGGKRVLVLTKPSSNFADVHFDVYCCSSAPDRAVLQSQGSAWFSSEAIQRVHDSWAHIVRYFHHLRKLSV